MSIPLFAVTRTAVSLVCLYTIVRAAIRYVDGTRK